MRKVGYGIILIPPVMLFIMLFVSRPEGAPWLMQIIGAFLVSGSVFGSGMAFIRHYDRGGRYRDG